MHQNNPLRYLWLDFETTGVNPRRDEIWEVSVIATDAELRELAALTTLLQPSKKAVRKVRSTPALLEMHTRSGLLDEITSIEPLPTVADVEVYLLHLLEKHTVPGTEVTLAGSGVSHFDREVITHQMPRLAAKLTYYSLDVGPARRLYLEATGHDVVHPLPAKRHRAEDDIRDDLRYARAYRALYQEHDLRSTSTHPLDRALGGLALVDAFHRHDVIDTPEGQLHTADTGEAVTALLRTTDPADVIMGLLDVASDLLRRTAIAEHTTVQRVVSESRNQYLQALSESSIV